MKTTTNPHITIHAEKRTDVPAGSMFELGIDLHGVTAAEAIIVLRTIVTQMAGQLGTDYESIMAAMDSMPNGITRTCDTLEEAEQVIAQLGGAE